MNQKEADIVNEDFVARDDTYNLVLGGTGGWNCVMENKLFLTDKFYLSSASNWEIGRKN